MEDEAHLRGVQVVRARDIGGLKRVTVRAGGQRVAGRNKSSLLRTLMFPDRDITWYPFAYHAGHKLSRAGAVNAVFSTSPNPTNHLIGMHLARRLRLPWVADFRDPWTVSEMYAKSGIRRYLDKMLETAFFRHADRILVVSEYMNDVYASTYPESADRIVLLRNGFDHTDFQSLTRSLPSTRFVLTYAGNFDGGRRTPEGLLRALATLKSQNRISAENFQFTILGPPEKQIVTQVNQMGLREVVSFEGHVSYRDALQRMVNSSALLVIETSAQNMTTKLYEYLGAQRPVLALVPQQFELARLVEESGAGTACAPQDTPRIKQWLLMALDRQNAGNPLKGAGEEVAMRYSREESTRRLANVLCEVTRRQ